MRSRPPDRFILGLGDGPRRYVIHTQEPRFVAELTHDELGDELLGARVCHVEWFDDPLDFDYATLAHDVTAFLDERAVSV